MSTLLENGTVLADRYVIKKTLGQGGMGAVYLAADKRIPDKMWAVKELWDFGDPSTRHLIQSQFQREASILATLDHPNLPRITDFFVDNNQEYLVMDYVNGKTTEQLLREAGGPLKMEFVLKIAEQLMDVLIYLHQQNPPVIFRDLKPANVMVTSGGKVKLIDFGIARVFTAGKTKDTIIMGTPGFAAPEQYGTGQSDQRSDIYGLGATLYFQVTGQDPADNPFHFEPPSSINPEVPKKLENAILKCVQMEPEKRFESVEQMKEYLFSSSPVTTDLTDLALGTRPSKSEEGPGISLEPEILNFGTLKRGVRKKKKFTIKGRAQRIKIASDRPWVRVYPSLVDGEDVEIGVTVYTQSLNHGGKYKAQVTLKGENVNMNLPVRVEIEPRHLNLLSYVLSFIFTVLSLAPLIGYLGFLGNLTVYFSVPVGERKSLKIFFYVTLIVTLLWTVIAGLYFGISYLDWFKNLFFK